VLCTFARVFMFLLVFVTCVCVCRLRAGSLPTFERLSIHLWEIDAPPSRGFLFIHQNVCRLRVGFHFAFKNSRLVYSSTCVPPSCGLSFHIRELDSHLFVIMCTTFERAFVSRLRTRYSFNRCPLNCIFVRWSCLLWDLVLVSLILFAYRITKMLQETFILFA
jgi:hypothetical protein